MSDWDFSEPQAVERPVFMDGAGDAKFIHIPATGETHFWQYGDIHPEPHHHERALQLGAEDANHAFSHGDMIPGTVEWWNNAVGEPQFAIEQAYGNFNSQQWAKHAPVIYKNFREQYPDAVAAYEQHVRDNPEWYGRHTPEWMHEIVKTASPANADLLSQLHYTWEPERQALDARIPGDSKQAGFVLLHPDGTIRMIQTHPDYQRQGVASAMLNHLTTLGIPWQHSKDMTDAGRGFYEGVTGDQPEWTMTDRNTWERTAEAYDADPYETPYDPKHPPAPADPYADWTEEQEQIAGGKPQSPAYTFGGPDERRYFKFLMPYQGEPVFGQNAWVWPVDGTDGFPWHVHKRKQLGIDDQANRYLHGFGQIEPGGTHMLTDMSRDEYPHLQAALQQAMQAYGVKTVSGASTRHPNVTDWDNAFDQGDLWTPKQAGLNGELPEGLVITHDVDDEGNATIMGHVGDQPVGKMTLDPDGTVNGVTTHPAYYRRGIATALWSHAQDHGLNPRHSDLQTDDGAAWAQTAPEMVMAKVANPYANEAPWFIDKQGQLHVGKWGQLHMQIGWTHEGATVKGIVTKNGAVSVFTPWDIDGALDVDKQAVYQQVAPQLQQELGIKPYPVGEEQQADEALAGGYDQPPAGDWDFTSHEHHNRFRDLIDRIYHDGPGGGGFTVDHMLNDAPSDGYYVSQSGGDVIPADDFMEGDIARKQGEIEPGQYVGAWLDNGHVYLDTTHRFDDEADAHQFGAIHGQQAIYDAYNDQVIPVQAPAPTYDEGSAPEDWDVTSAVSDTNPDSVGSIRHYAASEAPQTPADAIGGGKEGLTIGKTTAGLRTAQEAWDCSSPASPEQKGRGQAGDWEWWKEVPEHMPDEYEYSQFWDDRLPYMMSDNGDVMLGKFGGMHEDIWPDFQYADEDDDSEMGQPYVRGAIYPRNGKFVNVVYTNRGIDPHEEDLFDSPERRANRERAITKRLEKEFGHPLMSHVDLEGEPNEYVDSDWGSVNPGTGGQRGEQPKRFGAIDKLAAKKPIEPNKFVTRIGKKKYARKVGIFGAVPPHKRRKKGAVDPDWWEQYIAQHPYSYHVHVGDAEDEIRRHGLLPHSQVDPFYRNNGYGGVENYPRVNHAYVSDENHIYDPKDENNYTVFRIDNSQLDPEMIDFDEDYVPHFFGDLYNREARDKEGNMYKHGGGRGGWCDDNGQWVEKKDSQWLGDPNQLVGAWFKIRNSAAPAGQDEFNAARIIGVHGVEDYSGAPTATDNTYFDIDVYTPEHAQKIQDWEAIPGRMDEINGQLSDAGAPDVYKTYLKHRGTVSMKDIIDRYNHGVYYDFDGNWAKAQGDGSLHPNGGTKLNIYENTRKVPGPDHPDTMREQIRHSGTFAVRGGIPAHALEVHDRGEGRHECEEYEPVFSDPEDLQIADLNDLQDYWHTLHTDPGEFHANEEPEYDEDNCTQYYESGVKPDVYMKGIADHLNETPLEEHQVPGFVKALTYALHHQHYNDPYSTGYQAQAAYQADLDKLMHYLDPEQHQAVVKELGKAYDAKAPAHLPSPSDYPGDYSYLNKNLWEWNPTQPGENQMQLATPEWLDQTQNANNVLQMGSRIRIQGLQGAEGTVIRLGSEAGWMKPDNPELCKKMGLMVTKDGEMSFYRHQVQLLDPNGNEVPNPILTDQGQPSGNPVADAWNQYKAPIPKSWGEYQAPQPAQFAPMAKVAMPYWNNTWYHVTPESYLPSIAEHGLVPQTMGSSSPNWPTIPRDNQAVYLHQNLDAAQEMAKRAESDAVNQYSGTRSVPNWPVNPQTGKPEKAAILRVTGIDRNQVVPDPEGMHDHWDWAMENEREGGDNPQALTEAIEPFRPGEGEDEWGYPELNDSIEMTRHLYENDPAYLRDVTKQMADDQGMPVMSLQGPIHPDNIDVVHMPTYEDWLDQFQPSDSARRRIDHRNDYDMYDQEQQDWMDDNYDTMPPQDWEENPDEYDPESWAEDSRAQYAQYHPLRDWVRLRYPKAASTTSLIHMAGSREDFKGLPGWQHVPAHVYDWLDRMYPNEQHGYESDCINPKCQHNWTPEEQHELAQYGEVRCQNCGVQQTRHGNIGSIKDEDVYENGPYGRGNRPGGGTRAGLTMKQQGDLGEEIVRRIGVLPSGQIDRDFNSETANAPFDFGTHDEHGNPWAIEVKTVNSQGQPRFKWGEGKDVQRKRQFVAENAMRPALVGVRLNYFTNKADVFYRPQITDPYMGDQTMTHVGSLDFGDLNPFPEPGAQPVPQPVAVGDLPY